MSNKTILSNSNLKDVDVVSKFQNLWIIDLSNNMIECVSGLNSFVALGYVNLSNNKLSWKSLENIKELYIIYVEFHGNMLLENDPYYRQQIIDIFPRLFCLDGKFINAIERNETKTFFEKSNFYKVPIRRRLKKEIFRTTSCKSLRLYGKFGQEAFEFLTQFPNVIPLNEEWDKRKIRYISQFLASNMITNGDSYRWIIDWITQLTNKIDDVRNISDLYVVLVLYMANLEFGLESSLCEKAFQMNQLDVIKNIDLSSFFQLNAHEKILVLNVFLAVLSLANTKYQIQAACVTELYSSMHNLLWVQIRSRSRSNIDELLLKYKSEKFKINNRLSKSLIAAETIMILSRVDSTFQNLTDMALNKIIDHATAHENFIEYIKSGLGEEQIETDILINMILLDIQRNVQHFFSSTDILSLEATPYMRSSSRMSAKSAEKMIDITEHLTRGQSTLKQRSETHREDEKIMEIGDLVLLSSQVLAHVLAVPDRNYVIVQIQRAPMSGRKRIPHNSLKRNIEKINPNLFEWNHENGFWTPFNSTGDRIFLSTRSQTNNLVETTSAHSNKRALIDVSKINICDDSISMEPENENENLTPNVTAISFEFNQDDDSHVKETRSSSRASPRRRVFKSPAFVKHDFSEINSCLRLDAAEKSPRFISPRPRCPPNQVSLSSGQPVINDAKCWLGHGANVYKNVSWNPKNPRNMVKRFYVPGWIDGNPIFYQQRYYRK